MTTRKQPAAAPDTHTGIHEPKGRAEVVIWRERETGKRSVSWSIYGQLSEQEHKALASAGATAAMMVRKATLGDPPAVIETAYLRLPGDAAILRDFIARAEADLARSDGLTQTWPAFAADVRRAVELARRALGEEE